MTDTTDPLGRLLADEALAEVLRFAVLAAYASGWSDAFQTSLAIADARLAELVEEAGTTWKARLASRRSIVTTTDPEVPEWLAAQIETHARAARPPAEDHGPEPWTE